MSAHYSLERLLFRGTLGLTMAVLTSWVAWAIVVTWHPTPFMQGWMFGNVGGSILTILTALAYFFSSSTHKKKPEEEDEAFFSTDEGRPSEWGRQGALWLGLQARNTEAVIAALEEGALVNDVDEQGESPLAFALSTGQIHVVQHLLNARADVHLGSPLPLHCALRLNEPSLVKALLDAGAEAGRVDGEREGRPTGWSTWKDFTPQKHQITYGRLLYASHPHLGDAFLDTLPTGWEDTRAAILKDAKPPSA